MFHKTMSFITFSTETPPPKKINIENQPLHFLFYIEPNS